MFRPLINIVVVLAATVGAHTRTEVPVAIIVPVANFYITMLPPNRNKDEWSSVRDFPAKTGPDSLSKAVNLINRLRPGAAVIQESLTGAGSTEDVAASPRLEFGNTPNCGSRLRK